jgi:hypothetical protein
MPFTSTKKRKQQEEEKMMIEFIARRTPTCWVFDHEHQNTIDEPLCNGTEKAIDHYFEIYAHRFPKTGDQIKITAATEDFEETDTVLDLQKTDSTGSVYLDMVLFEEVWLCPWLKSYFGEAPINLYVRLEPVNIALENFRKNYAHPYKKFKNHEDPLSEFTDEELVEFVNDSYERGGRL